MGFALENRCYGDRGPVTVILLPTACASIWVVVEWFVGSDVYVSSRGRMGSARDVYFFSYEPSYMDAQLGRTVRCIVAVAY